MREEYPWTPSRCWTSSSRGAVRKKGADDRNPEWPATDRSRARDADLAEGRGAGLVGREERGGAHRLVSKSFGRGRDEDWRQVSGRQYWNFERAGGQVAHDVVKIAAVVHTLDPARIDGNRPRHRHEDDHQGHQEPDQSN